MPAKGPRQNTFLPTILVDLYSACSSVRPSRVEDRALLSIVEVSFKTNFLKINLSVKGYYLKNSGTRMLIIVNFIR